MASAIALSAAPAIQAAQGEAPAADTQGIARLTAAGAQVSVRRVTGTAQFVRLAEGKGSASLAPQSARAASATDQTKAFLGEHGSVFAIANTDAQLEAKGERTDKLGFRHAAFQQMHEGVPVFGAELQGHVDASGRLVAVNGTSVPGITIDTHASRSQAEASQIALGLVAAGRDKATAQTLSVKDAHLVIYRTGLLQGILGTDHLAYAVEVTNGANIREFLFIDAKNGKLVDQITGVYDALNRRAFDGQGNPNAFPPNYPNNPYWVEGDPFPTASTEANNMIRSSKEVYDMYLNAFGYESYDGNGAQMDAIFNRGNACPNASWNGTFISFCPGFTTDDVTAHEWSHAYTQYTDNLIYAWQSGALNEAYSDIFGETIDQINGLGLDNPNTARTAGNCTAFTPPQGQVVINSPAAIARTSPAQSAAFGPPLSGTGITGDVVVGLDAADGAGPSTTDGCSAFTNAAAVLGKIALVDRGTCTFAVKVKNAQNAGAVAVLIDNNSPTALPGMGGADATITIPSLGILQADGNAIKGASGTVNATLHTTAGSTDNSYRWLMGEEVTPGGALRDMFSPNCYSNPAKVSDLAYYACGPITTDQGGVHTNSGVVNKAYSLLVDGGLFNSQNVQAIGLTKAAHIYFRAKFYQVASTDFPGHASALEQACTDLRGQPLNSLTTGLPSGQFITATDCTQVSKAIAAVELRTPPTQCGFVPQLAKNPPANVCGVGPATLLYTESVEGSITPWTRTHVGVFPSFTARDWVKTSNLPGGRTGSAFFALDDPALGDCAADDESGGLWLDSPSIVLPATPGFPRVAFDHYVATEAGWDGGNVKVSVNGGAWQNTVFTQFTYNPYQFLLFTAAQGNTNPLAGQQAFTGADGGSNTGSWGKSIIDLAGVAQPGDSIRLRFAFGNDGCGGNDGWYVDDVNVYSCTAGGAATLSINDVTVTEGNTGSANATFTVTLSEASATTVTVKVNTANDTATAPSDYTALSNVTVTFAPGVTTRTVNVPVLGDTTIEPTEKFFVNLSAATNATIADAQGVGTIKDDDTKIGDFNGDGMSDIVWRDQGATGSIGIWYMNGTTMTANVATTPSSFANLNWEIQGTGDFNGDGKPDLLWRDQKGTGAMGVWLMNGPTLISSVALTPATFANLNWRIVGTGDFNGDGQTDIVLRDQLSTGNIAIWYMNGTTLTSSVLVTPSPFANLNWEIQGIGDFNSDGKPDLVWRDQKGTGNIAVWYMNGSVMTSSVLITPSPFANLNWEIEGIGDYNGDGKPDLLWRDQKSTGAIGVWMMNGVTTTSVVAVTPSPFANLNWRIVGPR